MVTENDRNSFLVTLYVQYVGEPESKGEVYGYWLFLFGTVTTFVGMLAFVFLTEGGDDPSFLIRGLSVTFATAGIPTVLLGFVVVASKSRFNLRVGATGFVVALTGVALFVRGRYLLPNAGGEQHVSTGFLWMFVLGLGIEVLGIRASAILDSLFAGEQKTVSSVSQVPNRKNAEGNEDDGQDGDPDGGGSTGPTDGERGQTGPPSEIPDSPSVSLTYDDVEKKEPLGSGGSADVYRATVDTADGEMTIAVKHPGERNTVHNSTMEQIQTEAKRWAAIDDHDHIVSVCDYGSEPSSWIAMEHMDARDLGHRAAEFDFDQALWTAIQTTKAIRAAHDDDVFHLDLKPENILFREAETGWDVPKVADWGLAKRPTDRSKSFEGYTRPYAAPEQLGGGDGKLDHQTDVYQLGAVFYELFTGEQPYSGDPATVQQRIRTEQPPRPTDVDPGLPNEIDEILRTAMAKDKRDRYENVSELLEDLQKLDELVQARPG